MDTQNSTNDVYELTISHKIEEIARLNAQIRSLNEKVFE